ncbi:energy transducer TonB [Marinobacter lacisalsi]|uniref:Protein TonB n=1 Tax=Marinobacter lacisalsi TaxID=475979 RepID=A0ABV8QJC4_9GAMM
MLFSALAHVVVLTALVIQVHEADVQVEQHESATLNLTVAQTVPPAPSPPPEAASVVEPLPKVTPEPVVAAHKPSSASSPEDVEPASKPEPAPSPQPKARPQPSVKEPESPRADPAPPVSEVPQPKPESAARPQVANVSAASSNVPEAPEASPAPRTEVPDSQARERYLEALATRIHQQKFYPRLSRRFGEQGRVVVSFVIQRSGELSDIRVVESSGYPGLDDAAIEALRRVSPFTKIPASVGQDVWPIRLPVEFSLSR